MINPRDILKKHADENGISVERILSKNRSRYLTGIRASCIEELRDTTNMSWNDIGREVNRHFATVRSHYIKQKKGLFNKQ